MLGLELAVVVALHLAGTPASTVPIRSLGSWLSTSEPTVVLLALARLSGLVIGYWLLTSTALYAAAHLCGWDSLAGVLRWVTLPVVRRVVHGVTAVSLTSASIVGPAAVSIAPAMAQGTDEITDGETEDGETGDSIDDDESGGDGSDGAPGPVDAAGWPDLDVADDFWVPESVNQPTVADDDDDESEPGTHTVVEGDNLWVIAENHLRDVAGRDVTEDEICEYWVRLIAANEGSLRSGDPDLIYPSEILTLPPVYSE